MSFPLLAKLLNCVSKNSLQNRLPYSKNYIIFRHIVSCHSNMRTIFYFFLLSSPTLNGLREPDRDYYNDLPGKVPPDIGPPPVPPLPVCSATLPNLKHHHSSSSSSVAACSGVQGTSLPDPAGKSGRQTQQWPGNFLIKIISNFRLMRALF